MNAIMGPSGSGKTRWSNGYGTASIYGSSMHTAVLGLSEG